MRRRPGIWCRRGPATTVLELVLADMLVGGCFAAADVVVSTEPERPVTVVVWKPSSGVLSEGLGVFVLASVWVREEEDVVGLELAETSSTWRVSIDRRGPECDCQCRWRRGRRETRPGPSSL